MNSGAANTIRNYGPWLGLIVVLGLSCLLAWSRYGEFSPAAFGYMLGSLIVPFIAALLRFLYLRRNRPASDSGYRRSFGVSVSWFCWGFVISYGLLSGGQKRYSSKEWTQHLLKQARGQERVSDEGSPVPASENEILRSAFTQMFTRNTEMEIERQQIIDKFGYWDDTFEARTLVTPSRMQAVETSLEGIERINSNQVAYVVQTIDETASKLTAIRHADDAMRFREGAAEPLQLMRNSVDALARARTDIHDLYQYASQNRGRIRLSKDRLSIKDEVVRFQLVSKMHHAHNSLDQAVNLLSQVEAQHKSVDEAANTPH